MQVTGEIFFEALLELFKVIFQDYREAFKRSLARKRDQGIFLCGQMCNFLNRLLRRVLKRSDLSDESDWDKVQSFDFAVEELLSILDFVQKSKFPAKALKVSKSRINVERD